MPYLQEAEKEIAVVKARIWATPKPYLYLAGAVAVFLIAYGAWLKWGTKPAKPNDITISAPVAKEVQSMPTATTITKIVYIKDKPAAVAKLGLPPGEASNPKEELVTATGIKPNKYGATTAVFINTSTGQTRTDIRYKESPWFVFRNDLAMGVGAGIGTEGKALAGRLRLDMVQIKEVTISPELEGNYAENRAHQLEGRAMIWAEWRK